MAAAPVGVVPTLVLGGTPGNGASIKPLEMKVTALPKAEEAKPFVPFGYDDGKRDKVITGNTKPVVPFGYNDGKAISSLQSNVSGVLPPWIRVVNFTPTHCALDIQNQAYGGTNRLHFVNEDPELFRTEDIEEGEPVIFTDGGSYFFTPGAEGNDGKSHLDTEDAGTIGVFDN